MKRYEVGTVEEAVELALKFKNAGKYDWFRGQLQADWMPVSSLSRALSRGDSSEEVQQRMALFLEWTKTIPALNYLSDPRNIDQVCAILQHFGFPTAYLDFSTEPDIAGFFAGDCIDPPPQGTVSTIFCLDTVDLRKFYDENVIPFDHERRIELISVNVDNLWRLQAQAGHFVYANHDWHLIYDMDRIDFPWTGSPAFPPRNRIYPEHRSHLEHLLENYFEEERIRLGHESFFREQRKLAKAGRPLVKRVFVESKGYDTATFSSPPPRLPSWDAELLKPWLEAPTEVFHEAVGLRHTIALRSSASAPSPSKQLSYGIAAAIRQDPSLRSRAVQWDVSGLPDTVDRDRLERLVREAWNGMRRLPYTDDDIAAACGAILEIITQRGCMSNDARVILDAFQVWCPDAMEVEFCAKGDSGSRGYCSASRLQQAISADWLAALPSIGTATTAKSALRLCHQPMRVLEFSAFTTLFGRELIPSQLARERPIVHFNPAILESFGLP